MMSAMLILSCHFLMPITILIFDSSEFETLSAQFSMVNANENDPIHNLGDFNLDGGKKIINIIMIRSERGIFLACQYLKFMNSLTFAAIFFISNSK